MDVLSLSEPAIYVIKEEDIKVVCSGCLSRGRNLYPLIENVDLFMFFLGHHYNKTSELFLCWECVAILRKIKQFQDRIWHAQRLLEQHIPLDDSVTSLSTLGIKKADTNLEIIVEQENVRTNGTNFYKEIDHSLQENALVIEQEKPKPILEFLETAATEDNKLLLKEENDVEDYGIPEDFDDYEAVETNDVIKVEKKQKTKKNSEEIPNFFGIKAFKDKVKITKNDIDLTDVNKYFEDVVLTDEDMENMPGKVVSEEELARYKPQRVCKPCSQVFKTKSDANRHKTFAHYLKNLKRGGSHKCLECKRRLASLSSLRAHWQQHGAARCALCGLLARVRTGEQRAQHLRTHLYRWACLLCPGSYKLLYLCDVCLYSSQRDFVQHYRALHMYCQCDLCGARFRRKGRLILHVAFAHTSLRCYTCGQQCGSRRSLAAHMSARHPALLGAPPPAADCAYCVECDKQFQTPSLYRKHLYHSVQHNPNAKRKKNVPCPECGKVFSRTNYMNRHRKLFHEKKTSHYCDICDKYLISGFSLRKHIEGVHHKVREPRNKICDLCGRGFQTNAILRHHRRTHTGERPHACARCPAAFAQKTALFSHERTQHKVD